MTQKIHPAFAPVFAFGLMSLSAGASAATLPAGYSEAPITQAISAGTAMEFSPDGKLFVLEQAGTIEVYQGAGSAEWTRLQANFFANAPLSVNSSGERGLLGIAFDPNYMSNRYVYVYHTTSSAPIHNRIVRYTANANGDLALAGSGTLLMALDNLSGATNHNGGAMHFGPDGKLYVAVGENATAANSQSISNRLGKMLRLNPDPSNPIPSDNPTSIAGIAGTTTGFNRAIWAAGLRNPFTFAFKPGTSTMFINDVGATAWEEINLGAAGANYGWNQTEGRFNENSFRNFTQPLVAYAHSGGANNYPPGLTYTGFAITGGAFYVPQTTTFPNSFVGDYFFGDYVSDWIRRFDPENNTVHNFATGAGAPVDLRVSADGALLYLSREAGRVFRIVGPNTCPSDVNSSGTVNVDDLLAVISNWGPCKACPADIAPAGGDGTINVDDLLAIINAWGACP